MKEDTSIWWITTGWFTCCCFLSLHISSIANVFGVWIDPQHKVCFSMVDRSEIQPSPSVSASELICSQWIPMMFVHGVSASCGFTVGCLLQDLDWDMEVEKPQVRAPKEDTSWCHDIRGSLQGRHVEVPIIFVEISVALSFRHRPVCHIVTVPGVTNWFE